MIGFGTDGIRGRVGVEITTELSFAVGHAAVEVLGSVVYVGRDTRPSGPDLEDAVVAGVVAAGGAAVRLGVVPTPALAWIMAVEGADAAVMITASHNPARDNGLKVFGRGGAKPGAAVRRRIEEAMRRGTLGSVAHGSERLHPDPAAVYLGLVDDALRASGGVTSPRPGGVLPLSGRRLVVDAGNGAGHDLAPGMVERLGGEGIRVGDGDGARINDGCGALHPERLAAVVREVSADGGLALDGDGDRVVVVDATGRVLEGDALLWVAARRLWPDASTGPEPREVVGTVMTNAGLEVALGGLRVRLRRTPVGDENVTAAMIEDGARLGGEPSGHLMIAGGPPSADGLYVALRLLLPEPRQLVRDVAGYHPYVQVHRTVPLVDRSRFVAPVASIARAEALGARVVVRPSGTEPIVRVLVEHANADCATEGAEGIRQELMSGAYT